MSLLHPKALEPAPENRVRHLFEIGCRNLFLLRRQECHELGGSISVEAGPDRWLLDFARGTVERSDSSAALELAFTAGTFERLLDGELSPAAAYAEGALRMRGDRSLVTGLCLLFAELGEAP